MKIEVKQHNGDRYDLYVNGIRLGQHIYSSDKKYLEPKKWADVQLKKRNIVIDRNIARLETELSKWKKEKEILNS